jgi:hypothetical protein
MVGNITGQRQDARFIQDLDAFIDLRNLFYEFGLEERGDQDPNGIGTTHSRCA